MPNTDRSIVGDSINFRGLVYAPMNENGVIFLFGKIAADLNMRVEEIKPGFPDCIARRFVGKGWQRVSVEFEFKSSNFRDHRHDANQCDLIVCWEHDWRECPIEVIELKSEIQSLPNPAIEKPGATPGDPEENLRKLFKRFNVPQRIQRLYRELEERVLNPNEDLWRKVTSRTVTLYSPERVFAYIKPRRSSIGLFLFTRGEPTEGVKPVENSKWGRMRVKDQGGVLFAANACTAAWHRIRAALAANETTMTKMECEAEEAEDEENSQQQGNQE